MAITIKQIAQVSGVSRGTVDRVLNNRGRVSPETKELVAKVARELGYKPNIAGKALAARKKQYTVGIILCSEGNEFYDDVLRGIKKSEEEALEYGVSVILQTMKGYNVETQLKWMEELKDKIQFLILNAINDEKIADKINEFKAAGIPVITVNTDVEKSQRLCFVGSNFVKSGETAAGILGLLCGGEASIGIATGSVKILGHNQRISGFSHVCKKKYPKMNVVDIIETNDDDNAAYLETKRMLLAHTEVTAIYIVAAGVVGVCKAVEETKRDVLIVCCDSTPSIVHLIKKGRIKAAICQQPYTQGLQSLHLAVQYLVNGILPENDYYAVKNEIKIAENI